MKTRQPQPEKVIKHCDTCGKQCNYSCRRCDRDWCTDCIRKGTEVVGYWSSAIVGHLCAVYCTPCDIALSETKSDRLREALVTIWLLRCESNDWQKRAREADSHLKSIASEFGIFV